MSINNFIPTVWSARLQNALETRLVFAQPGVINRDYEGEIMAAGDTVKILMIGDPEVKTYTKNTDIDSPEKLDDADTTLKIDQAKYFNFEVDDVDRRQGQTGYFDTAMRRASYNLRKTADTYVAGVMYAGVATANMVGSVASPKTITSANESYDYLIDLQVKMDEADIPEEDRWCIVPPWFNGLLEKRDEFTKQGTPQAEERLANGRVGRAAGFMILTSNNVPKTGSDFRILAGVDMATTYADQIVKVEAYRPEKRFSDAVKGLHVYGTKVVRPEMLACLHITRP